MSTPKRTAHAAATTLAGLMDRVEASLRDTVIRSITGEPRRARLHPAQLK